MLQHVMVRKGRCLLQAV